MYTARSPHAAPTRAPPPRFNFSVAVFEVTSRGCRRTLYRPMPPPGPPLEGGAEKEAPASEGSAPEEAPRPLLRLVQRGTHYWPVTSPPQRGRARAAAGEDGVGGTFGGTEEAAAVEGVAELTMLGEGLAQLRERIAQEVAPQLAVLRWVGCVRGAGRCRSFRSFVHSFILLSTHQRMNKASAPFSQDAAVDGPEGGAPVSMVIGIRLEGDLEEHLLAVLEASDFLHAPQ